MSDYNPNGWEPDPQQVGNQWRSMFEEKRPSGRGMGGTPPAAPAERDGPSDDDQREIDLTEYRPWVLQRGRGHPALMLDLRRFEPKSGQWVGWAIAYPQLAAAEYIGERLLSLDFGPRKFVLEGDGLLELAKRLQQGAVLAIQEYAAAIWPRPPDGPIVTAIRRAGMEPPPRG